jgi:cytochrome c oxidase cbb3-type subunit III
MAFIRRVKMAAVPLLVIATSSLLAQVPPVDAAAAARGAKVYGESCAKCHGPMAHGTATAPDLIRSTVILHDRYNMLKGREFPAILTKAPHNINLKDTELADLSQFLTGAVNKILRSGYSNTPINVMTGNAQAGEVFFNGAGGCTKCHSATGDLAGLGKRYSAPTLQQKFLFPNAGIRGSAVAPVIKKSQVAVTLSSGKAINGELVRVDDFNVTLREQSGQYMTIARTTGMKVDIIDPYAGHVALLDRYTDPDIHNLLAYLVTLK